MVVEVMVVYDGGDGFDGDGATAAITDAVSYIDTTWRRQWPFDSCALLQYSIEKSPKEKLTHAQKISHTKNREGEKSSETRAGKWIRKWLERVARILKEWIEQTNPFTGHFIHRGDSGSGGDGDTHCSCNVSPRLLYQATTIRCTP